MSITEPLADRVPFLTECSAFPLRLGVCLYLAVSNHDLTVTRTLDSV